ncbi:unnamed protein product [Dimorphilus gyrociliatus]|uniref:Uncharacterized protein n=1 Tax=Dimorphilus gyrociliatus TaxID=2664684 RepID=A0A7I8VS03_9ANNE|nr:unnamed protein product [Dimorphilus gyrociliatus]
MEQLVRGHDDMDISQSFNIELRFSDEDSSKRKHIVLSRLCLLIYNDSSMSILERKLYLYNVQSIENCGCFVRLTFNDCHLQLQLENFKLNENLCNDIQRAMLVCKKEWKLQQELRSAQFKMNVEKNIKSKLMANQKANEPNIQTFLKAPEKAKVQTWPWNAKKYRRKGYVGSRLRQFDECFQEIKDKVIWSPLDCGFMEEHEYEYMSS